MPKIYKAVIKAGGGFIDKNKIGFFMVIFIVKCLFFIKINANTLLLQKFYLLLQKYKNILSKDFLKRNLD